LATTDLVSVEPWLASEFHASARPFLSLRASAHARPIPPQTENSLLNFEPISQPFRTAWTPPNQSQPKLLFGI